VNVGVRLLVNDGFNVNVGVRLLVNVGIRVMVGVQVFANVGLFVGCIVLVLVPVTGIIEGINGLVAVWVKVLVLVIVDEGIIAEVFVADD